MLRFPEQIMLLLLDEEKGSFAPSERRAEHLALAGGVLMELALELRIDTDLRQLVLLDAEPTGDPLLDPVLADIAAAECTYDARYWVERTRSRAAEIRNIAIERLIKSGVVWRRSGKFLRAQRLRPRPTVDDTANREVKQRIMSLVFGSGIPHPRDVVIICLCDVCGLFESLLPPDDLARARPRIEQLGRLDLIGQAVMAVVAESDPAPGEGVQALLSRGRAVHGA